MIEFKKERYEINGYRIILKHLPCSYYSITITELNKNGFRERILEHGEYYVDYDSGIIYLRNLLSCNEVEVKYHVITPCNSKLGSNPLLKSSRPGFKSVEKRAEDNYSQFLKYKKAIEKASESIGISLIDGMNFIEVLSKELEKRNK